MSTHNISKNGSLLNRAVLVLNTNYAPLEICSARRAICLYYLEKVDILIKYNDKVHSPSITLKIPSVIKLRDFIRYNSMELILSRRNIFHRDNYTCQYCGNKIGPHTIDHVIPKERHGGDTWENLVTACAHCNLIKGNRSPEEMGMALIKKPVRPNRIHYFQQFVGIKQIDWRPFLFMESLN
ncbi:MAG: HNH endonuclease [Planctomycetia bacterium]|nr:HNH endonuclease [Planctomycetia bacterium]